MGEGFRRVVYPSLAGASVHGRNLRDHLPAPGEAAVACDGSRGRPDCEPWRMNWLTLLTVVALVFYLGVALVGGVLACIMWVVVGANYYSFAPEMARMQETRSAVARLPCVSSFSASKVYGDAVEWNQEVRSQQIWNHRILGDPFIPDGWDTVTTITIPACGQ